MIIQKKSLADMVAEQLRRQITEGVYTIGDKLPTEPALMKTFKVGRSSIREAVKLLVNMGVVQVRQGGRNICRRSIRCERRQYKYEYRRPDGTR